jgi:hypothetical protein
MSALSFKNFSRTLIGFTALFLLTPNSVRPNENEKIFLSYCSHFGSGVSFSFQSCANSNFNRVARALGTVSSYCSNFGDEVSFSFTSCINRNFQNAQSRANGSLYLQYCSNFDRTSLGFGFVSCVNSNFRAIERYVAAQESDQQ